MEVVDNREVIEAELNNKIIGNNSDVDKILTKDQGAREATEVAEAVPGGQSDRQSRQATRGANSMRKRDTSWDKKWQDHVERNVNDDVPRSSVFAKTSRKPGKLNNTNWESRVEAELQRQTSLPPRTPPSSHKRFALSPSPRPAFPHHGASAMDYSPQRVATPPYPASDVCSSSGSATGGATREEVPLPPPPPVLNGSTYPEMEDTATTDDSGKENRMKENRILTATSHQTDTSSHVVETQQQQQHEQEDWKIKVRNQLCSSF